jgi:hypothetical protein
VLRFPAFCCILGSRRRCVCASSVVSLAGEMNVCFVVVVGASASALGDMLLMALVRFLDKMTWFLLPNL